MCSLLRISGSGRISQQPLAPYLRLKDSYQQVRHHHTHLHLCSLLRSSGSGHRDHRLRVQRHTAAGQRTPLQGYLAHKKQPPPPGPPQDPRYSPTVRVLGEGVLIMSEEPLYPHCRSASSVRVKLDSRLNSFRRRWYNKVYSVPYDS